MSSIYTRGWHSCCRVSTTDRRRRLKPFPEFVKFWDSPALTKPLSREHPACRETGRTLKIVVRSEMPTSTLAPNGLLRNAPAVPTSLDRQLAASIDTRWDSGQSSTAGGQGILVRTQMIPASHSRTDASSSTTNMIGVACDIGDNPFVAQMRTLP
jgi:hypothetical protein